MQKGTKIVCFGESLIRFQAVTGSFFNETHEVKAYSGGSEANTAVRLTHLGFPSSLVSAAPDAKLTRDYLAVLNQRSVDTSDFIFSGDRLGAYYLLSTDGLTKGEVIYDRKYSSFYQLEKGDVDWDSVFENCGWFHWTAITPALSRPSADLMREGLEKASSLGIPISVDLNYRNKLWQYGKKPFEVMPELVEYCDLILGNIWAANTMLGTKIKEGINIDTPAQDVLEFAAEASIELFEKYPKAKLTANTFRFMENASHNLLYGTAHTRGDNALSEIKETHDLVDRIGSGDAFMAGIISGYIRQKTLQGIIDLGVKEGFQKLFSEGDF